MNALLVMAVLYLSVCTCKVIISPEGCSRQCVENSDLQEQLMIMKDELGRITEEQRNTSEQLRRTTEQLSRITEEQRTTKGQLQKLKRKMKQITQEGEDVVEIRMAELEEQVSDIKEQIQQLINGTQNPAVQFAGGQNMAENKTVELDKQLTNGTQDPAVQLTYGSCADLPEATPSGIYNITPAGGQMLRVYCDMVTDGGGWTVFQRRQDGSVNFYRNWRGYQDGFGKLDGEFWLGNEVLALITNQRPYELRVDLEAFSGRKGYAVYSNFSVASSADKYRLSLGSYTGNAGNSFRYDSGKQFSTYDQDNDRWSDNCAAKYKGGWWFWRCSHSHLNGEYLGAGRTPRYHGVLWNSFTGWQSSLKHSEMKIRPQ